jgi:hypothetical protein
MDDHAARQLENLAHGSVKVDDDLERKITWV